MQKENWSSQLSETLEDIRTQGLFKSERLIDGMQSAAIEVQQQDGNSEVLNFCANNYLGLADHPDLIAAAKSSLDQYGFGMASVRFICGTQTIHRQLEQQIASWLGYDDSILYAACFDANGGLFEVRATADRGRRHLVGLAQPRIDHRRHSALQSQTLSLCQL